MSRDLNENGDLIVYDRVATTFNLNSFLKLFTTLNKLSLSFLSDVLFMSQHSPALFIL